MIERFEGESGRRLQAEALAAQKMVCGNRALAEELADRVRLRALKAGEALIEQDADDNELYFILAGTCDVVVNGRQVGKRRPGDHLSEIAAIQPAQRRSATALAAEDVVVACLAEPDFADLASRHPEMYRTIAQELARRLMQRNALIGAHRDQIRVFIISSAEAVRSRGRSRRRSRTPTSCRSS